jgi:hypothetical protein
MGRAHVLREVLHEDAQKVDRVRGLLRAISCLVRPRQHLHDMVQELLEVVCGAVVLDCSATEPLTITLFALANRL